MNDLLATLFDQSLFSLDAEDVEIVVRTALMGQLTSEPGLRFSEAQRLERLILMDLQRFNVPVMPLVSITPSDQSVLVRVYMHHKYQLSPSHRAVHSFTIMKPPVYSFKVMKPPVNSFRF